MSKLTTDSADVQVSNGEGAAVESSRKARSSGSALVRADGRDPQQIAFEIEVVSFFVDAADILGVPKSVAAIYGTCFASAEPLCFADFVERLEISQGSISQGLRVLREIGAVKPAETLPPSVLTRFSDIKRREFYVPELELRKLASHFIEQRLEKQLDSGKTRLRAIQTVMPSRDVDASKELKARLQYLQSWHDKSRGLVPIIKTFLKLG